MPPRTAWRKVGTRRARSISKVTGEAAITLDADIVVDARIALGAVGDGEDPAEIAAMCVAPHMPWVVGRDAGHVRFAKLAAVTATARVIAVEVPGGVDVRDRATGAVEHVPGAALDALGARLAVSDGSSWRVRALLR